MFIYFFVLLVYALFIEGPLTLTKKPLTDPSGSTQESSEDLRKDPEGS